MSARTDSLAWEPFGWDHDQEQKKRWFWSATLTLALYAAGIGLALWWAQRPRASVSVPQPAVEVTFRQEVLPPPPPSQPVEMPAAPPPAAAPAVPKHLKVRKIDQPVRPKPLVQPQQIPQAPPKEADPSEDRGVAVAGDPALGGDPAGLEGGLAGAQAVAEPIALPEDADPPIPLSSNPVPEYPAQARAEGKTGLVVLKVVIAVDGSVQRVEVLRGEEPFVTAALQAVQKWRYQPARYKEQPISVYRIIQIPFKLKA